MTYAKLDNSLWGCYTFLRYKKEGISMSITMKPFGCTKDGQNVTKYTMTNKSGASVSVTDFGAITVSIIVPDRNDQMADVCLGFDDVKYYEAKHGSMGDTVGRYGNRIGKGQFTLDGVKYQLMQIIAVEGSMVYTLQYHATEVNYSLHTNVVENIRSNFRFG